MIQCCRWSEEYGFDNKNCCKCKISGVESEIFHFENSRLNIHQLLNIKKRRTKLGGDADIEFMVK